MPIARKTAVVQFTLPEDKTGPKDQPVESKPLTREDEYDVQLFIDGRVFPAGFFQSPCNDEQWRDFVKRLRDCNVNRNDDGYRGAVFIRSFGADLYQKLVGLSPKLREFLCDTGTPRRLVIQTFRPELHLLPWSALYDENGRYVADGDLSIVQAWDDFTLEAALFPADLKVRFDLNPDTPMDTETALKSLPKEWTREKWSDPDILHIEVHGNSVNKEIGEVGPWTVAERFGKAKMALLWSCYSSAANSSDESPALCLHRLGTAMVLSFQAELHNLDAKSIAEAFYSDVFGAAASRDPESALVRIRSDKFKNEFNYAAWASMTVYLRSPVDLSALSLNGPRVPTQAWIEAEAGDSWASVFKAVGSLVPGVPKGLNSPIEPFTELPQSVFAGWNGTVIRLDGDAQPLSDSCIKELGLSPNDAPTSHPADRLSWFFGQIARYGQPLVVWTHSSPRHLEFLRTIKPSATLAFLLLYQAEQKLSVPELVDEDQIVEAIERSKNETPPSGEAGDEYWHAMYFAYARSEMSEDCRRAIRNMSGAAERLLACGNFVNRFGESPQADGEPLTDLEKQQRQEEYYRQALNEAIQDSNLRDVARAKLELGYLLQSRGEIDAADLQYRAAAQALERTPEKSPKQPRFLRDSRWHSALGRSLRDRAELLSGDTNRLTEAVDLLKQALVIHSYHGRRLQIAYCRLAAARIALATERFADGVLSAMDAANDFEALENWRAWAKAIELLLDILAKTHQTARMIGVADLAIEKIVDSNLLRRQKEDQENVFNLKIAQALFDAGDMKAARTKMEAVGAPSSPRLRAEADRLRKFLGIEL